MYAIVETGGKQYKVSEGDVLFVEKLIAQEGESVVLDKVLAIANDDDINLGNPFVEGASIDARVVKNGKSKKIIVYKYKPKKGYHKKQGHRQPYSKIEIEKINES